MSSDDSARENALCGVCAWLRAWRAGAQSSPASAKAPPVHPLEAPELAVVGPRSYKLDDVDVDVDVDVDADGTDVDE